MLVGRVEVEARAQILVKGFGWDLRTYVRAWLERRWQEGVFNGKRDYDQFL